ncbi:glycosyltransferase family 2 protein, partial [Candidatus Bathyarchaeota archaeon]|nr:glycosyltransferase family 2 protein [Candidatus Bathyarchaeota archaeon]
TWLARKSSYVGLTDAQSGFRAYNRKAIGLLRPVEQGMGASTEILLKA